MTRAMRGGRAEDRGAGLIDREVVQQNDVGVRGQRFIELFERIDFHFDLHEVTRRRAASMAGRMPPAIATWLSLMRIASSKPNGDCDRAVADGAFQGRAYGVVLRCR